MANPRLEVKNVARKAKLGNPRSIGRLLSYISGERVWDAFDRTTYDHVRNDVLNFGIFLPNGAPAQYRDLQHLCNAINKVETRKNARTGREFLGSLPNEISASEQWRIVCDYIHRLFTDQGLVAVAAHHAGVNEADHSKDNPHAHIIVSTRTLGPDGFSLRKDRLHNQRSFVELWRKEWAVEHNRAYERCRLAVRVSDERLLPLGVDLEPLNYLSRIDYQRELRGKRTVAGDLRRAVQSRNEERIRQCELQLERENELEFELLI